MVKPEKGKPVSIRKIIRFIRRIHADVRQKYHSGRDTECHYENRRRTGAVYDCSGKGVKMVSGRQ